MGLKIFKTGRIIPVTESLPPFIILDYTVDNKGKDIIYDMCNHITKHKGNNRKVRITFEILDD